MKRARGWKERQLSERVSRVEYVLDDLMDGWVDGIPKGRGSDPRKVGWTGKGDKQTEFLML
jgi:hypothetical protein